MRRRCRSAVVVAAGRRVRGRVVAGVVVGNVVVVVGPVYSPTYRVTVEPWLIDTCPASGWSDLHVPVLGRVGHGLKLTADEQLERGQVALGLLLSSPRRGRGTVAISGPPRRTG